MNKEKYFEMVNKKLELDKKIEKLYQAYNKIFWTDCHKKINANIKWNDILRQKRADLIEKMAEARKNIDKETLTQWKIEFGKFISL
ncbi:hypothetical protein [Bacillus xiapuensis]|uniref:Uncharacterized protein n=1 Tax=Bacillus xiapuensis TaxID=2014075 RepID=A0ABU6N8S7_9BACI|nr:hypothetical protein [Bacillus xiapuensis]